MYMHLALLITANLQWSAFWNSWQPDLGLSPGLKVSPSAALGPSLELRQLFQSIKHQYSQNHLSSYYSKLSKIMLHTISASFGPGFEFDSLFRGGGGVSSSELLPSSASYLSSFIFPLNISIVSNLPDSPDMDRFILENSLKVRSSLNLGLTDQALKLIDISRRWFDSAKLSIMKIARESENPTRRCLITARSSINDYMYQVMPNLLPFENDGQIGKGNEIMAGLLLNDILATVKKTGLDTLDSSMLECLIVQSLHLACYLPKSNEKNIFEQLCYELVSAVGLKSWQDIIKRLKIKGVVISRVDSDEAAAFLCKFEVTKTNILIISWMNLSSHWKECMNWTVLCWLENSRLSVKHPLRTFKRT